MEETMADSGSMPMCPMAETCRGMMDKPRSGVALIVTGIVLMVLGVAVVVEPRILLWLVAAVLVVMGFAMLMLAKFMRTLGARFPRKNGDIQGS
jgi:peptidoglycan/LPS O-acetylase OafA/YrhL